MKTTQFTAKTALSSALVTAMLMAAQSTQAAGLTIGQEPLFLTEGVAPNLLVTLDDSGSMAYAFAPDSISGRSTTRRFRSSDYNPMYYNGIHHQLYTGLYQRFQAQPGLYKSFKQLPRNDYPYTGQHLPEPGESPFK